MIKQGFDCSTPLTQSLASKFFGQGNSFVGRYLASVGSYKRLSAQEAQAITDAGLYIVSFFERWASRAGEGAAAGVEDGKLALKWAKDVGQPEGTAIYTAVDYDAGSKDFDQIEAYMRAFDSEINGYELGIYGSYTVVKAMYERGVTKKLMQTYAWSNGRIFDKNSIFQYKNDIIVNGIGVDLNTSNGDAGGWKVGMAIQQKQEETLKKWEADTINSTWISPAYEAAKVKRNECITAGDNSGASAWQVQMDNCHDLANALRKASGQPEE